MPSVVVVEDNDSIALMMETILSTADYSVHIARSGEEALEICHSHSPKLIFMDLELPNMDGFTACAMLRNEYPEINIIGFSAEMSPSIKKKCLAAGMADAYDKAVDPDQIIEIAEKHTATA
jgi:CheY-like chemotaxis protein